MSRRYDWPCTNCGTIFTAGYRRPSRRLCIECAKVRAVDTARVQASPEFRARLKALYREFGLTEKPQ